MADYLQELGLTPATSRAPKTIIIKAQDLTDFEIWLLLDLNTEWAKIEEGTGEQQLPTTETFASFFKAVFSKWDSSCVVVSLDNKKPTITKCEKGLIVGTWAKDLAESRASIVKRKKEDKDESGRHPRSFAKPAKMRMTRGKAEAQSAHIYDQAEIMRLDTHNKNTLITLARQRIMRFSENGVGKNIPPASTKMT
ncbi:hypothetical protein CEP52_001162 [Fusarium oligoseptatum]|uniref:Uncharacterized protein n=1 Tax=Fusarium oligoseptatum TaxID=2604345 RepID=A0A428UJZ4_9HYPO|nr:hypothetical protein CEP52_001162 [Fusarium oligoseptatum]